MAYYEIQKLHDIHFEMLRMIFLGYRTKEIARSLNVKPRTVVAVRNSAIAKEHLKLLQGAADYSAVKVRYRIGLLAPNALEVLEGILQDEKTPSQTRIKVAMDLLDRGGHKAPTVIEDKRSLHLTEAEVSALKSEALQSGAEDIEFTEEGGGGEGGGKGGHTLEKEEKSDDNSSLENNVIEGGLGDGRDTSAEAEEY